LKKLNDSVKYLATGQTERAAERISPIVAENILSATRQRIQGATDAHGNQFYAPQVDENGETIVEPLRMTRAESLKKSIGFTSSRLSMINKRKRTLSNIQFYATNWRTRIRDRISTSRRPKDKAKALEEVYAYNKWADNKRQEGFMIPDMEIKKGILSKKNKDYIVYDQVANESAKENAKGIIGALHKYNESLNK